LVLTFHINFFSYDDFRKISSTSNPKEEEKIVVKIVYFAKFTNTRDLHDDFFNSRKKMRNL